MGDEHRRVQVALLGWYQTHETIQVLAAIKPIDAGGFLRSDRILNPCSGARYDPPIVNVCFRIIDTAHFEDHAVVSVHDTTNHPADGSGA